MVINREGMHTCVCVCVCVYIIYENAKRKRGSVEIWGGIQLQEEAD